MAVAFRSNSSAIYTLSACNKPTGVVSGDVMVAWVYVDGNPTVTGPSGWTKLDSVSVPGGPMQMSTWYKLAGGAEPSSYTWTTTSGSFAIHIDAFSGVDGTTPINVHGISAASSGNVSPPSVTTTIDGCYLLACFSNFAGAATTPPSGYTETNDADGLEECYKAQGTQGATGTLTPSGMSGVSAAAIVAIAPPSAGGGGTRTVPTSLALLATVTRSVPTSLVLLATSTRTIPATLALKSSPTHTVPSTLALLGTQTRIVPSSLALLATTTRSVPTTLALNATLVRAVPATLALKASPTRTVPSSLALLATTTRTVPVTIALSSAGTSTRTVPTSIALQATLTRAIPTSIALLASPTRTVPSSLALLASPTRTIPTSLALQATQTRTVPVTLALSAAGTSSRTVPVSLALSGTATRTVPTSLALLATAARAVPTSLALQATAKRTVPTTLALNSVGSRAVPSSLALNATLTRVVPVTLALGGAAVVRGALIGTFSSVSRLKASFTGTSRLTASTFTAVSRLAASFVRSVTMAQPFSTTDVTATILKFDGTTPTPTTIVVTVSFPDGTSGTYSLANGDITSQGAGAYKLTYVTKNPGPHRETWLYTATDGSIGEFENTTAVSF